MARLYYGHVKTNGAKIHYYRTGDEKPSVVFLHGLGDNGLCWSRLALRLEPFYDVIMVDARGHGLSDATPTGYSWQDRAADVAGLLVAMGLEKVPLVGHSMGAETATLTAADYPKLVGCLILEDPPFKIKNKTDTPEDRKQRAEYYRKQIQSWRGKTLDELIEIGKRMYPVWDPTDLFQWGKAKQQVNPLAYSVIEETCPPWQETMEKVKCPLLLISGDPLQGGIVTPEVAQQVKKLRRGNEILQIEAAGHNIRRDQFEVYCDAVKKYLRAHTRW